MPKHPRMHRGFTLIEILAVVLIIAVLAAIAFPSYRQQVYKGRRPEAKTALLDLAGREERNLSATNNYTSSGVNLGYGGAFPMAVGNGYYQVTATVPDPNQPAPGANQPPTFLLTAVAIGDQVNDAQCQTYTVNNLGQQAATDNGGADQTANCW